MISFKIQERIVFFPWHDNESVVGHKLANWELDKMMELVYGKQKDLDFKTTMMGGNYIFRM